MDHRFSKREYFINCTFTLFFTCMIAASFYDITTCPYIFSSNPALQGDDGGAATAAAAALKPGNHNNAHLLRSGRVVNNDEMQKTLFSVFFFTHPSAAAAAGVHSSSSSDASMGPFRAGNGTDTNNENNLFGKKSESDNRHSHYDDYLSYFNYQSNLIGERLVCHMVDIIVWIYIVGLVLFMLQKYIYYRKNGMHYFFLDYCYFHNACLVCFLVWRLVGITYADAPLVSWRAYFSPERQRMLFGNRTQLQLDQQEQYLRTKQLTVKSFLQQWIPFLHNKIHVYSNRSDDSGAVGGVEGASYIFAFPDGIYAPKKVTIYTIHYAIANFTDVQFVQTFFIFFMLFAGTFGPILSAIWMWKNALLFHSFDRMSSCYLHLFPAIIQVLFLHILFTTAKKELSVVDPVALVERAIRMALKTKSSARRFVPGLYHFMQNVIVQRIPLQPFLFKSNDNGNDLFSTTPLNKSRLTPDFLKKYMLQQQHHQNNNNGTMNGSHQYSHDFPRNSSDFHLSSLSSDEQRQVISIFANYAQHYQIEALCGDGTLCHELQQNVTYMNLLCLHLCMFFVWQVGYHCFHEYRRNVREHRQRRLLQQQQQRQGPHSSAPRAAPQTTATLAEGAMGDLSQRMTAYTWMMEHPPGGKRGLPYRFVTCCGTGRLPSTILFAISQLLCHVVFFSFHYVVFIAPSFHYFYSVLPLAVCLLSYVALCIYHAACMNKKWIKELQRLAAANGQTSSAIENRDNDDNKNSSSTTNKKKNDTSKETKTTSAVETGKKKK